MRPVGGPAPAPAAPMRPVGAIPLRGPVAPSAAPMSTTTQRHAPPAGPSVSPIAPLGDATPDKVWDALLQSISERPALSWIRWLRLVQLDSDCAHVAAVPGRREVMKFLTDRQKGQLAELLRPILGRPVRIQLEDPPPVPAEVDEPAAAGQDVTPAGPRLSPRQALSLPLVRQVLEMFDADLVEVRPAPTNTPPAPETADSASKDVHDADGAERDPSDAFFADDNDDV